MNLPEGKFCCNAIIYISPLSVIFQALLCVPFFPQLFRMCQFKNKIYFAADKIEVSPRVAKKWNPLSSPRPECFLPTCYLSFWFEIWFRLKSQITFFAHLSPCHLILKTQHKSVKSKRKKC